MSPWWVAPAARWGRWVDAQTRIAAEHLQWAPGQYRPQRLTDSATPRLRRLLSYGLSRGDYPSLAATTGHTLLWREHASRALNSATIRVEATDLAAASWQRAKAAYGTGLSLARSLADPSWACIVETRMDGCYQAMLAVDDTRLLFFGHEHPEKAATLALAEQRLDDAVLALEAEVGRVIVAYRRSLPRPAEPSRDATEHVAVYRNYQPGS